VHVSYRGQGPALADLLGGRVDVMFVTTPGTTDYVRTGKLRALAVTTAARVQVLPELPTVADFVPGYEASQWYGIGAPKAPAAARAARAQSYPARLLTLLVFVPAGGTPDIIARLVGQSMAQRLGQSVVIDNRPGGGGNLALQAAARAPADGYTLLLAATPHA